MGWKDGYAINKNKRYRGQYKEKDVKHMGKDNTIDLHDADLSNTNTNT